MKNTIMKNSVRIISLSIIMALFSCSNEPLIESETLEQSVLSKAASANFPAIIDLPNGFYPEGIVLGNGNDLYAGSFYHGGIYKMDLRTGIGAMLVPEKTDRLAAGLDFDPRTNYIYAAGGFDGHVYVYDALSGDEVGAFQLTTGGLINDVIITENAAYFTDTFATEFHKLPLGSDGSLPGPGAAITIPMSGDFEFLEGLFNSNGIVANDDGTKLIIGNTDSGALYSVDAATGVATTINVGGPVFNNDGLVLRGNKLYVVQNFSNQISVIKLNSSWDSGVVSDIITSSNYIEPTSAAIKGNMIYAVNFKFFIALPPIFGGDYIETTPYEVVGVKLK